MKADSRDAQSQKLHYPPLNSTTASVPLEHHCPQKEHSLKIPSIHPDKQLNSSTPANSLF